MSEVAFLCPGCSSRLRASQAAVDRAATITCPRCQALVSLASLVQPVATVLPAPAFAPAAAPPAEPTRDESAPRPKKKKRRRIQGEGVPWFIILPLLGFGVLAGLIALVFWLWPGQADTRHEESLVQVIRCMENMLTTLGRIRNRETAEKELPELRQKLDAIVAAFETMGALGEPIPSVHRKLKQRYEPMLRDVQRRFITALAFPSRRDTEDLLTPVIREFESRVEDVARRANNDFIGR